MAAANAFIDALLALPLLTAEQMTQLPALQQQFTDVTLIGEELIRRGWLTSFQTNELAKGKGQELVLDKYVILDLLGQGGMGAVYKARQSRLDRIVALKLIRREALKAPGAVERFQREARVAAQLSHANVVSVFDSGESQGIHFLVMEFMEGTDLARLLAEQGRLSVGAACDYIRQAALGLQHAHERGLVHRDIKPHNLMLTKKGVLKVMDLGLARTVNASGDATSEGLTASGSVLGTADYLAPEQAQDARRVDIRADIYSLGCTLYHLLSGEPPFEGGSLANKLVAHMFKEPEALDKKRPEVPAELATAVRRMMAKKREERYDTPAEVAAALASFAGDSTSQVTLTMTANHAAAVGVPPVATALHKRGRRAVLLAGFAAAVLLAGLVFTALPPLTPDTQQAAGTSESERNAPSREMRPKSLDLDLGKGVTLELVLIQVGSFRMGSSDADREADIVEKPQHEVAISKDFYLGKYLVTQQQYTQIMGKNPSHFCKDGEGTGKVADLNTERFPVETVSWTEAQEFCGKVSQQTKRRVELPTEAQWEYACRAGKTTRYYCGATLTSKDANFGETLGRTTKVGDFPPNPWGLCDLHGNVWQWCADGLRAYTRDKGTDPKGPDDSLPVLRGGSWNYLGRDCRCSTRHRFAQSGRCSYFGFRVMVYLD